MHMTEKQFPIWDLMYIKADLLEDLTDEPVWKCNEYVDIMSTLDIEYERGNHLLSDDEYEKQLERINALFDNECLEFQKN